MRILFFLLIVSCGSASPRQSMDEWIGKSREEVRSAFSHLTPKTEQNRITYRDSDPLPSPARCAVIPCYPWFPGRISCTYEFKFENDRVRKATRSGNCREDQSSSQ